MNDYWKTKKLLNKFCKETKEINWKWKTFLEIYHSIQKIFINIFTKENVINIYEMILKTKKKDKISNKTLE